MFVHKIVFPPPPQKKKGPKMTKSSRQSAILTRFLGGWGGDRYSFYGQMLLWTSGGVSRNSGNHSRSHSENCGLGIPLTSRHPRITFQIQRAVPRLPRRRPGTPQSSKHCPFSQEVLNLIIRLQIAVFLSCTSKTLDGRNSALVTGL